LIANLVAIFLTNMCVQSVHQEIQVLDTSVPFL